MAAMPDAETDGTTRSLLPETKTADCRCHQPTRQHDPPARQPGAGARSDRPTRADRWLPVAAREPPRAASRAPVHAGLPAADTLRSRSAGSVDQSHDSGSGTRTARSSSAAGPRTTRGASIVPGNSLTGGDRVLTIDSVIRIVVAGSGGRFASVWRLVVTDRRLSHVSVQ